MAFEIILVKEPIKLSRLAELAESGLGDFVKAVVDLKQNIMAINADMHVDEEQYLLEECNSEQENLWGINIYPAYSWDERVEFDSMINLRPSQNNRSRNVEDLQIREQILKLVKGLVND
jgi:hypothetical protein